MNYQELSTSELIARLRRAAAIWLKNDDLLLLEELIRRLPKRSVIWTAPRQRDPVIPGVAGTEEE